MRIAIRAHVARWSLPLLVLIVVQLVPSTASAAPGDTTRVSVSGGGAQADGASAGPSVSADGRYVAFGSDATNLIAGDGNGSGDVFVVDRQTGAVERVSVATGGTEGNGASSAPSISADGRYVAFESSASNLVAGDTNAAPDIFVRDRQTGTTVRASVATDGTQSVLGGFEPAISGNGGAVSFYSESSNLVAGDTGFFYDVFVRDLQAGTTERVSVSSSGAQGNSISGHSAISGDGRYVAFESDASNLVGGDTNSSDDIFVFDRSTDTVERVSVTSAGSEGNGGGQDPAISADGNHVAFRSSSNNLVGGDTNPADDIFVHDRQSGTTERVSVATDGTEADLTSFDPALSADGRYVAFASFASNLVPGDSGPTTDVFVRDRQTDTTERIPNGVQGDGEILAPALTADGADVAFTASATNLVSGDTNGVDDVFFYKPSVALETTITGGPTASGSPVALFTFTATPPAGATFECWVDNDAPAACTSPYTTGVLSEDTHTFHVRATNADGPDPTPATQSVIMDFHAPTAQLQLDGQRTSSGAYAGSAHVDLDASDPAPGSGVRSKFCVVDPPAPPATLGAFGSQPCGLDYSTPGTHTVYGIANDNASNESQIVSQSFTVVPTPETTITDGPSGETYLATPYFTFTSSSPGAGFRCRFDSSPFQACSSPFLSSSLPSGPHTFEVAATTPEGALDPTPAQRSFSIGAPKSTRFPICEIRPFLHLSSDLTSSDDPPSSTCFISNSSSSLYCSPTGSWECTQTDLRCPLLSICREAAQLSWQDADGKSDWDAAILLKSRSDSGDGFCTTGLNGNGCNTSASATTLVLQTSAVPGAVSILCFAYLPVNTSVGVRGPDGARSLRCSASVDYRPAEALDATTSGSTIHLLLPGGGVVEVTPAGQLKPPRAGRGRMGHGHSGAPFKSASTSILDAGQANLKLKLSKAAKKKLKKKGKLTLSVTANFVPAGSSESFSRTQKVTLTKPVKPPKGFEVPQLP
ncbi:MAG: hypothetical protein QOI10_3337 [Solirubrobacterales bacterium]|jgi:Tol biopolymer transport system component|nr:hypothetical protein [Solirubrobacterales bacterium]